MYSFKIKSEKVLLNSGRVLPTPQGLRPTDRPGFPHPERIKSGLHSTQVLGEDRRP